jgi:TolB-like protein/DNA-binding winged helix-turn-helix (wHTH) protein/Flp pilus assembly protein TadD
MNSNAPARRPEQVQARCWTFADCEFDEFRRELRVRGVVTELEPKPVEVLLCLLAQAGQVVTKEDLLEAVWPGTAVVDGSLATAVSKLRKALGDVDSSLLLTVPKVGYRLGVPVTTKPVAEAISSAAAQPAVEVRRADVSTSEARLARDADARRRSLRFVGLGLIAALALVAAAILRTSWFAPAKSPVVPQSMSSVAVLPFLNLSGDPAQEYLADGMTDELIMELSKIGALKVISRTSAMRYKNAKKTLPEIARELHVDGVVEGSVLRSGTRLRIATELIYAANDAHVWEGSYDRDLGDILGLQRELARQIAREIKATVSPSEELRLASRTVVNPQAHDLILRGRFFWNQRTREALTKALEYFQQASEIDPDDPLAYAGLADTYVELVGFGDLKAAEGFPKAKAAALQAIALDDSLAEPHTALGYALAVDWNWVAAEKEFQRALERNPGYVTGIYQYAFFLSVMGKQDEAIPLARRAVELDPLSQIVLYRAGRVEFQGRHYDEARLLFGRILELNPTDPLGLYGLGLVFDAQGKYDLAISALERQKLQQGFDVAEVYAAAGKPEEARRRMADAIHRLKEEKSYVRPGWVAEVYIALGDKDEAMRWLERGYKERDLWLALLRVWPRFDPLRSDPRFQDLVRRMKFLE